MKFQASIVLDSEAHDGASRLTTFKLVYPRFIHAELLTHRMFSRNTSSSRAIPYTKMREQVAENPACPIFWGKNQKGMAAQERISQHAQLFAEDAWLAARDAAIAAADKLYKLEVHKQHVNRLLEPFLWVVVLCSATTYSNFFRLRRAADAQPEIRLLADLMHDAYVSSRPQTLDVGDWHIPFAPEIDDLETRQQVSVARCARVSYLNFSANSDVASDRALFAKLAASGHWSPFEHVAQVAESSEAGSGNFSGFQQLRKRYE